MEAYKKAQRANEDRFKRSQRGTVLWRGHQGAMRVNKPGCHLSKAEKKRVKKWSMAMAILNAASEGKTVLRNKALKVSKDGCTLTLEGGCEA